MDLPEVTIGDKLFVFGHQMTLVNDFDDYSYNALMGYKTTGGFFASLEQTGNPLDCVPGFVIDLPLFSQPTDDLEDITDKLAKAFPLALGTRVWVRPTNFS